VVWIIPSSLLYTSWMQLINWRLQCRSWAIDCRYEVHKLFDARHGVKKRCHKWHWVIPALNNPMPCLASFFDAMPGVKKLINFMHTINCPTSAFEPSTVLSLIYTPYGRLGQWKISKNPTRPIWLGQKVRLGQFWTTRPNFCVGRVDVLTQKMWAGRLGQGVRLGQNFNTTRPKDNSANFLMETWPNK